MQQMDKILERSQIHSQFNRVLCTELVHVEMQQSMWAVEPHVYLQSSH